MALDYGLQNARQEWYTRQLSAFPIRAAANWLFFPASLLHPLSEKVADEASYILIPHSPKTHEGERGWNFGSCSLLIVFWLTFINHIIYTCIKTIIYMYTIYSIAYVHEKYTIVYILYILYTHHIYICIYMCIIYTSYLYMMCI